MRPVQTRRLPVWSPVAYVFFAAIPLCTATVGSISDLPLAATAVSLPVAALVGWFFGWRGAIFGGIFAALGYYLPYFSNYAPLPDWGTVLTCSIIVLAFGWMGGSLRASVDRVHQISGTDSLTGLNNRNRLIERLEEEVNRAMRSGESLCVVYLDCDHFKRFNDTKGHLAGDALLMDSSRVLDHSVRNYDIVARMGGDEFAIVFPDADEEIARITASRVHERLLSLAKEKNWSISWSMGVAVFPKPIAAQEMIHAADQLMYQVKQSEKGRLVIQVFDETSTIDSKTQGE